MTVIFAVLTWTWRLIFAALLVLCGLAALAVICGIAAAPFRRRGRVAEDARADGLPGPGRPQPSGVSRHEETTIEGWTPAQMAFIRGDTDELPDE